MREVGVCSDKVRVPTPQSMNRYRKELISGVMVALRTESIGKGSKVKRELCRHAGKPYIIPVTCEAGTVGRWGRAASEDHEANGGEGVGWKGDILTFYCCILNPVSTSE
jgi:hypothetical protein